MNNLLKIRHKSPKKIIGLMSGTSMDGIDACLTEISGSGRYTKVQIFAFDTYSYDEYTRTALLEACDPDISRVDKICQLNFHLGKLFANAAKEIAKKAGIPLTSIDLIGSHGQTIYHSSGIRFQPGGRQQHPGVPSKTTPKSNSLTNGKRNCKNQLIRESIWNSGSTLQIGEPSVIAQETGITTVADFRKRDIAAGGQGAPLVPYVDFILFGNTGKGRAIQNIGGIANVTFLPEKCDIDSVIAFDTGPGNLMIDRVTEIITGGTCHFDEEGLLASKGRVVEYMLHDLLNHPFFSIPPPKTAGREDFGKHFTDQVYKSATDNGISDIDLLSTVTAFTAYTIVHSYRKWIMPKHSISEVIISGGGSYNRTLLKFLDKYLDHSINICTTDVYGIPSRAKEAMAFAVLANETISGNPNNLPAATGARKNVVMGKIVP